MTLICIYIYICVHHIQGVNIYTCVCPCVYILCVCRKEKREREKRERDEKEADSMRERDPHTDRVHYRVNFGVSKSVYL